MSWPAGDVAFAINVVDDLLTWWLPAWQGQLTLHGLRHQAGARYAGDLEHPDLKPPNS